MHIVYFPGVDIGSLDHLARNILHIRVYNCQAESRVVFAVTVA
jgi:hypothetical protein